MGDKLLGIRVRYMFLYTAVLKRYLSRLGPQSRFRDKLLGIRVRYLFSVHGTKKTVSRTTLCRPVTPLIVRRWDEKTQHSHEVTAAAAAAAAAAAEARHTAAIESSSRTRKQDQKIVYPF